MPSEVNKCLDAVFELTSDQLLLDRLGCGEEINSLSRWEMSEGFERYSFVFESRGASACGQGTTEELVVSSRSEASK